MTNSTPIPTLDDMVVIRAADLQKMLDAVGSLWDSASIDGCDEGLFVADTAPMNELRTVAATLRGASTLAQSLRLVDGDPEQGNGPVMMVLPAGMSDDQAAQVMNEAARKTAAETRNGEDGEYFEGLQANLAQHGVALQQGIVNLHAEPWDGEVDLDDDYPREGAGA